MLKYVNRSPLPASISYIWNFGRILGVLVASQIVSGLLLRTMYRCNPLLSFTRVIRLTQDVPVGAFLRSVHANGASFLFIFLYLHIGKAVYYRSFFTAPLVWIRGLTIYLLFMATAFLGYVLPWGQISLWGATVITNLISAIPVIGTIAVEWVWGGFRVDEPTLGRFYSLHFLVPLVTSAIIIVHLAVLHNKGRTNPLLELSGLNKIRFAPYFLWKDFLGFAALLIIILTVCVWYPNRLGDPENYIIANRIVTPPHIIPEWYFLFAYAILRVIPNKLGGVIGLLTSIVIFYALPFRKNIQRSTDLVWKFKVWILVGRFFGLTVLGSKPVEFPYTVAAVVFSVSYFTTFIVMYL